MTKQINFPYPTFFETIRCITRIFDLKESNNSLDQKVFDRVFDPEDLNKAIQTLSLLTAKSIGIDFCNIVMTRLTNSLKKYTELLASTGADGVSRSNLIPLLLNSFIKDQVVNIVSDIHRHYGGPHPTMLFSSNSRAVATVLNWLEKSEISWSLYVSSLSKEQKDRFSSWKRGDDIPSSQSLYLLQSSYIGPRPEAINWQRVRALLFLARAIDYSSRNYQLDNFVDEVRVSLWNAEPKISLEGEITKLQLSAQESMEELLPSIGFLQHELMRTKNKDEPHELMRHIKLVRDGLLGKKEQITTKYWIDWHEARWNVFSGNLDRANELYKQAFEDSLFRAGNSQKEIINESLVVAASLDKPDKVFLKHLKWSLINLRYDIPSVNRIKSSKAFNDSVENWEMDLWRAGFLSTFPQEGWFKGTAYNRANVRKGPLTFTYPEEVKPDYRYPDRKIKVGEGWKKSLPQLIWFLMTENYEVVEKLIEKGASVNVTSDVDDTPILIALESMNVTSVPSKSLDGRFFRLISNQEHSQNIINRRTQKLRLLPITSAVDTGKLEIVKRVLELGADPNGRGDTDEQTALNICLKYILMIKDPERFKQCQDSMEITPEALDSIRRFGAGLSGYTLDQQRSFLNNTNKDPKFKKITSMFKEFWASSIRTNMKLNTMRDIATLLIDKGADVNAEHASPVKGYTPLMLAAENDEIALFRLMLIKGGDPAKAYTNAHTGKSVDCWEISKSFNSRQVMNELLSIQHFFSRPSIY
jgi:ankyrin repeat protein